MKVNIILYFLRSKLCSIIPDNYFIKIMYRYRINRKLNLSNPKTFNEKLQWLKLYDRNPQYTNLVDKYEVKKYITNIIGEEHVIPTYGVYDKFEDIDFEKLPKQFVIKCTHDSGGLVVCKNKNELNIQEAGKKINKCLKRNYYYSGREWPYKNVKPRIIVEKYMEDKNSKDLKDYKFFCFTGKVECFKIDFDRYIKHRANYYDKNMDILPFGEVICPPDYERKIEIPKNFKEMINIAEKLAKTIPFVRIDLYNINGKIFFGEMTFYPASGFGKFTEEKYDYELGNMLSLPKEKIEENNEK